MSKNASFVLVLIFLIATSIIVPLPVKAQSKTIVVPDDYPTITSAIGNATNGDTILVRSGTYSEQSLKSNHSISLIGEGLDRTIVNLNPPIINYSIFTTTITRPDNSVLFNANNIRISGLTMNCYGPFLVTGDNTIVISNSINDYAQYWIDVSGNYVTVSNNSWNTVMRFSCNYSQASGNTGTGSLIIGGSNSYNSIFDNKLSSVGSTTLSSSNLYYRNIVQNGLGISTNENDLVYNNTVTGCTHGITMISGSNNVIIGNRVVNNLGEGLANNGYVQGSFANCGVNNTFIGNYVSGNAVGILIDTTYQWHGSNFTVYNNDFIDNAKQVQVIASNSSNNYQNYLYSLYPFSDFWNFSQHGNYWSDYMSRYPNASEIGLSGIWDTPYILSGGEQDYYPLVNPFDVSTLNIQLPSWANVNSPTPIPTPTFPILSPASPSPSPSPTASPSPSLPPSTTQLPTINSGAETPKSEPTPIILIAVASVVVALVVSGLMVYFKNKKRPQEAARR